MYIYTIYINIFIHVCVYLYICMMFPRFHIPAAGVLSVRFPREYDHINLAAKHPKLCTYFIQNSVHIHTYMHAHTCSETSLRILMWNASYGLTCKNTPIKPDRSHWMIRSEKPQVEVWLALDSAVKQQQKTQYDVSPSCDLNAPRSDTAGTKVCVQTSIQLISIASLAWLGNQPSRPLQLKRRLDKRLVKYSKLVHCNGKEPDKKKQFRQSR